MIDRRAIIVGVATIGSVIAMGRGVPLWREWDLDQRARATIILTRAAEFDRTLLTMPHLADSARRVAKAYANASSTLLVEASPTVASARLAELVADAADEAAVRVTSVQIKPDSAFLDHFARVTVRLAATGDIESLIDLLQALEDNDTLLAVKELWVTPSDPAAPGTKAEALRFQILVQALVARPSGPAR